MKQLVFATILFFTCFLHAQLPDELPDGVTVPLIQLDSTNTSNRDAQIIPAGKTRIIWHKDGAFNRLEWKNPVSNEWEALGGSGGGTNIATSDLSVPDNTDRVLELGTNSSFYLGDYDNNNHGLYFYIADSADWIGMASANSSSQLILSRTGNSNLFAENNLFLGGDGDTYINLDNNNNESSKFGVIPNNLGATATVFEVDEIGNVNFDGVITGDGSGLTNLPSGGSDNLGDHTATQDISIGTNAITGTYGRFETITDAFGNRAEMSSNGSTYFKLFGNGATRAELLADNGLYVQKRLNISDDNDFYDADNINIEAPNLTANRTLTLTDEDGENATREWTKTKIEQAKSNATNNKMAMLGFDSLTSGAGGNSLFDTFTNIYHGAFPNVDASLGFVHIDNFTASELPISFNKSAGLNYMIDEADFTADPVTYSVSGKGVYVDNGTDENFSITANKHFSKVRIYYLQRPDGGSFRYGFSNVPDGSKTTQSMVGTLSVQYVELERTNSDTDIVVVNDIDGKAAFFGMWFTNTGNYDDVCVTSIAKGGMTMAKQADLNSTFRQYWYGQFTPAVVFLNGGTNDRGVSDKATFKADLKAYIDDVQAGSPNTRIVIVEPNQTSDYESSFADDYTEARTELKTEEDVDLLDLPKRVGNHAYFNTNGLMIDGEHPSSEGYRMLTEEHLKFLGVNSFGNYKEIDNDQFTGGVLTVDKMVEDVPEYSQNDDLSGVEQTAYTIGLINSYTDCFFELKAYVRLSGSGNMRRKTLLFKVSNATIIGNATGVGQLIVTDDYNDPTSGTIPDVTFTLTLESDRAVLKYTPSNNLASISISGVAQLSEVFTTAADIIYYY